VGVADLLFPTLHDEHLGPMRYWWGRWTGDSVALFGHHKVRVRVPGTRHHVSPRARRLLEQVAAAYPLLKEKLLAELYAEFESAREEIMDEIPHAIRSTTSPEALWPYVTLVRVCVDAYGVTDDVELAYELAWDPEHSRGLTVRNGTVADYCGSVAGW
jgi:hypothetical protein